MQENGKSPKKKFFDPLKRKSIKTMSTFLPVVKTKSKLIEIDEEMYLRLLAINTFKMVPLVPRVLLFENAPIPLSLFYNDGNITSTKKSDFTEKLKVLLALNP